MRSLEILLLVVEPGTNASTIKDHIDAFRQFSRHRVSVLNNDAPILRPLGFQAKTFPVNIDLEGFDVLVIHYTNYLADPVHFEEEARQRIRSFHGLKVLFIQDEYRTVDATVSAICDLEIDVLFTCVPRGEIEKVYPASALPGVTKVNTLTGFVPDRVARMTVPSLEDRSIDVGYRGRKLSFWLGELSAEKWQIAGRFLEAVDGRDLQCDVSYREEDRIYGRKWPRFVASCKAVLGVESGASVFDFTGDIQRSVDHYVASYPKASFEEVQARFLSTHEHRIRLNQISPRCFEAAALRTAMILYEGEYSGILKPDRHYIPLRKDYANIDDVITKIRDIRFLRAMVKTTYEEIAMNQLYSYGRFIADFDDIIEHELLARNKLVMRSRASPRLPWMSRTRLRPRLVWFASRRLPAWLKPTIRSFAHRVLGPTD